MHLLLLPPKKQTKKGPRAPLLRQHVGKATSAKQQNPSVHLLSRPLYAHERPLAGGPVQLTTR